MTGLECLKAEMLKRGFTKSQTESKTVIGVLEIIARSEGRYTDLDRLQKEIESAKKTLAEYQRGVIKQRAMYEWFKANNKVNMETVIGWANAIVEETQKSIDAVLKAISECETAEGRDAIRAAQTFVNSVSVKTAYDNTAYIRALGAILSRGSVGAIETLKKINPKLKGLDITLIDYHNGEYKLSRGWEDATVI